MSHANVYSQASARAPKVPIATVESTSSTYQLEVDAAKMRAINQARAEGRNVPILTVEFVDHDA